MPGKNSILIIDNDEPLCRLMETILTDRGYAVRYFTNPYDGVAEFRNNSSAYSLLISDIKMPGMDGIEVLEQVKRGNPVFPVIVITAHATVDIAIQAMRKGADDMLPKPFEAAELIMRVGNAFRHSRLLEENKKLKEELMGRFRFENIVGISKGIKDVLGTVEKIAPRDIPALIIGESGTGKELIAQAIHYNSPRREKPFIAVNCGALPQNLLESELFGHRKGAFTGAAEDKTGLIESANSGTLFLDEIANLNVEAQKGLLRFLQEKELRRVGDTRTVTVDTRIISATNVDLTSAIKKGEFREDLFYRLNGITIALPPLRERSEDIPLLAAHHVARLNKKFDADHAGFTAEAMSALQAYDWPGNVRQLYNVIESALALSSSRFVDIDVVRQFVEVPCELRSDTSPGEYGRALEQFEKEYFTVLLSAKKWNVDDAAQQAGINMATLYRKIKKLNLRKEEER